MSLDLVRRILSFEDAASAMEAYQEVAELPMSRPREFLFTEVHFDTFEVFVVGTKAAVMSLNARLRCGQS